MRGGGVLRYQHKRTTRWWALVPWAVLAVLVVRAAVLRGEVGDVAAFAILVAVGGALTVVGTQRWRVTVTDDGLELVALWRTARIVWSDVVRLDVSGHRVLVTTRQGTFVTPLRWDARAPVEGGPVLVDAVRQRWVAIREGEPPVTVEPWFPRRDRRGRVVIRRPLARSCAPSFSFLGVLAGGLIGRLIYPTIGSMAVQLGGALVLAAPVVVLTLAHHAWARVTIDEHEVVSRSLSGVARVPREQIYGVVQNAPAWSGPARGDTRLALARAPLAQPLAAPVSSWTSPLRSDPDLYRIWAWLNDELVAPAVPTGPPRRDDHAG